MKKEIFLLVFFFYFLNEINTLNRESSEIIEISLINGEDLEIEIEPGKIYKFVVKNENYLYRFENELKDFLVIYNKNNILESERENLLFQKDEIIYINYFLNLNYKIKCKIIVTFIYDKLNSITTYNSYTYFTLKSTEESIAYFDSVDKNAKIFISPNDEKHLENMGGNFWKCSSGVPYYIRIDLFDVSAIRRYFYPLNINSEIKIKNYEPNFLYLQKSTSYVLNLAESYLNKLIKLSDKTPNSIVDILQDGILIASLDKDNPYYQQDNTYKGKLTLEILDDDAFIEFLSEGNSEILEDTSVTDHKLSENTVYIKLQKTQKSFEITISSSEVINFSLSNGVSNKNNFYILSNVNYEVYSQKSKLTLQYLAPFKYIDSLSDEFLFIFIKINKVRTDQKIYISYKQFSEIDDVLDKDVKSNDALDVITNLLNYLNLYVYLDIAKNPPIIEGFPNYHHRKVDLIKEIKNVNINNRKFYEFYQEIEKILTTTRDLHFSIKCAQYNKVWLIKQAYLPFNFIIDDYEGKKRIFIQKNQYFNDFDSNIQTNLNSHLNIPLKKINNMDPFDYIQNWSQFSSVKNLHAQFTYIIDVISQFYLYSYPVFYWNLTANDYEFEDNFILRLSYKIKESTLSDKYQEFNQYFFDFIGKSLPTLKDPSIEEIEENFLIYKGIKEPKKVIKENIINWDIEYWQKDQYIKCRVDDKNQVNVFVQNSFYLNLKEVSEKIFDCAKLFHSNNYPIIIVETKNGGGYPKIAFLMIQLFQIREVEMSYSSFRLSDYAKQYYRYNPFSYINPKTCENIMSFEELEEETDHYNYDGLNIEHKRSKPFLEIFTKSEREAINNFRKEYINSKFLKKPTDIIIFTDSYSFSSASTFIKGFQNIGGAITVGYFGNPNIGGIDLFDASQSDSGVNNFPTLITFGDMAFQIGLTVTEIFNDFYQQGNPIPREYQLNPVDYRVDIYSKYSDELYEKFINEGKNIHKKFNEENFCNSNNKKLILHDENCYNMNANAHGGYICGDNNYWDKSKCVAYYCDIGYYYDLYKKECVQECKSGYKAYFIHEKSYSNFFDIKKEEIYEFYIINSQNYYMFKSSEDNLDNNPRITFLKGPYNHLFVNLEQEIKNDFQLEIKSLDDSNIIFIPFKREKFSFENFIRIYKKLIFIIQLSNEHILYIKSGSNDKIKYAIYTDEMDYLKIIKGDNNYFKTYSDNKIMDLEKDEIYILYFDYKDGDEIYFAYINIDPVVEDNLIQINDNSQNYLYLQKDKRYKIEFQNMRMNTMLKLSKNTINSEVKIIEQNVDINSENYYYELDNNIAIENGILQFEVTGEDAFIEIMFKDSQKDDFDILDFEQKNFDLKKKYNIITIPKSYSTYTVIFEIKSLTESNYTISQGYSLKEYNHFPDLEENDLIQLNNYKFIINKHYKDKNEFMDDEFYTIMIILLKGNLNLKIEIDDASESLRNCSRCLIALVISLLFL